MWPNGTQRTPGMSFSQAAVAFSMKAGTLDTGTDTSFLTLAPSRFWASECSSRSRQMAARWVSDAAMAASVTMPSSSAFSRISSIAWRMPALRRGVASSTSA